MFHCLFYPIISIYSNSVLLFSIILARFYFIHPNLTLFQELERCVITNTFHCCSAMPQLVFFSFLPRKRAEITACGSLHFASPVSNNLLGAASHLCYLKAKTSPCWVGWQLQNPLQGPWSAKKNANPLGNSQWKHV